MRMTTKLIGVLAVVMILAPIAQAQPFIGGEKELGLSATWSDTDDIGSTVFIDLLLGFMLTGNHEIGPVLTYMSQDPDEDGSVFPDLIDNDQGTGGIFYRYNFDGESVVPFIGGAAALPFGDLSDVVDYTATAEAGVRVMPGERASLNIRGFYERQFAEDPFDDFDHWGVAAGISIFFGR